jgi:hypothetical protein
MSKIRPFCFVIKPFRPELHYFYLFIKRHIEDRHNIDCERGDAQILTKPILDKVSEYIKRADVIIGDCTGRNPNVFYELGIAHAADKNVILLTQDDVKEAPSDVRHYEFIRYSLSDHTQLLDNLDNALQNVFVNRYEKLYHRAQVILGRFHAETKLYFKEASRETFVQRVSAAEKTRELPSMEDDYGLAELLLPRIIDDSSDAATMTNIMKWLGQIAPKETLN